MQHIIFVVVRGHGQHNTMVTQLIQITFSYAQVTQNFIIQSNQVQVFILLLLKKKTVLLASVTANIEKETSMYNLSTPNRSDDSPCLSLAINNNWVTTTFCIFAPFNEILLPGNHCFHATAVRESAKHDFFYIPFFYKWRCN